MPNERCECGGELLPGCMVGMIIKKCDRCGRAYAYREVVQPGGQREPEQKAS